MKPSVLNKPSKEIKIGMWFCVKKKYSGCKEMKVIHNTLLSCHLLLIMNSFISKIRVLASYSGSVASTYLPIPRVAQHHLPRDPVPGPNTAL